VNERTKLNQDVNGFLDEYEGIDKEVNTQKLSLGTNPKKILAFDSSLTEIQKESENAEKVISDKQD